MGSSYNRILIESHRVLNDPRKCSFQTADKKYEVCPSDDSHHDESQCLLVDPLDPSRPLEQTLVYFIYGRCNTLFLFYFHFSAWEATRKIKIIAI